MEPPDASKVLPLETVVPTRSSETTATDFLSNSFDKVLLGKDLPPVDEQHETQING